MNPLQAFKQGQGAYNQMIGSYSGSPSGDPYEQNIWSAFKNTQNPEVQNYLAQIGLNYMDPQEQMNRIQNQLKIQQMQAELNPSSDLKNQALELIDVGSKIGDTGMVDQGKTLYNQFLKLQQGNDTESVSGFESPESRRYNIFQTTLKNKLGSTDTSQEDYGKLYKLLNIAPNVYTQNAPVLDKILSLPTEKIGIADYLNMKKNLSML